MIVKLRFYCNSSLQLAASVSSVQLSLLIQKLCNYYLEDAELAQLQKRVYKFKTR